MRPYFREKCKSMDTLKKIGALLAVFVALIGTVWAYVCVIKAMDSIIPLLGLILLTVFAIPSAVWLVRSAIGSYGDFKLEYGDEFCTDKGEHLRVVGFLEDGTPECEEIK